MRTVLLLTSDRMQPFHRLERRGVSVIPLVGAKYAHLYHAHGPVEIIDDVADLSAATKACAGVLHRHRVDGIVAATERSMATGGWLRTHFGFAGMQVDTALFFSNKLAMKTRLAQAGIPTMRFCRIGHPRDASAVGEAFGWPVVIKTATGSGTVNVWRIDSKDELQALLQSGALTDLEVTTSPLLAESFADIAAEYHLNAIVQDGKVCFSAAFKYINPPLQARGSFYGSTLLLPDEPIVVKASTLLTRVVEAFGMSSGVVHLEVIETADGLFVGEAAARPGGAGSAEFIERVLGVDLWDAFIGASLFEPLPPVLPRYPRDGLYGYCSLPCKSGTVQRLSTSAELLAIPGVEHVDMFVAPGDVVKGKRGSAVFFSGRLFFHLPRYDELPSFMDRVMLRYSIEVD